MIILFKSFIFFYLLSFDLLYNWNISCILIFANFQKNDVRMFFTSQMYDILVLLVFDLNFARFKFRENRKINPFPATAFRPLWIPIAKGFGNIQEKAKF